jgi:hypothetical protein
MSRGATMQRKVFGRCLCGHITYEYEGEIGPAGYCHCEDCRRCTGSAFNVSVRLNRASFRITGGQPRGFTKRADSGNELTRHFCPECGSPIYTSSPKHPEIVYAKAGSLDDPSLVVPTHQSWTASAVPWSRIERGLESFSRGRQT